MSRNWRLILSIVLIAAAGCGSIRPIATATPESGTPGFFSQIVPTSTQAPLIFTPTPIVIAPSTTIAQPLPTADIDIVVETPEEGGGLVRDIIQGFILPIWNFLLSLTVGTVQTLWVETGRAGGVAAQATCCGLPAILLVLWVTRLYTTRRRR